MLSCCSTNTTSAKEDLLYGRGEVVITDVVNVVIEVARLAVGSLATVASVFEVEKPVGDFGCTLSTLEVGVVLDAGSDVG